MCNSNYFSKLSGSFDRTESIYDQIPSIFNLAAYLLQKNIDKSEKIAFYHCQRSLTYRQLETLVPQFAGMLEQLGSRREERVIILMPDSPQWVVAFLGAIWHGNVAVLVNEAVSIDDIAYILGNSRANIVVTTADWQQKLATFYLPDIKHWIQADNNFLDTLNHYPSVAASLTSKDEPAFWAYTSGSTGRPKGVIHAQYSAIVACVRYAVATLELQETDIIYTAPPMAFSYGLGTSLYMPLFLGASAVLSDTTIAFGYIENIHTYQPSVFFGIPHNYATMLALHQIAPLNPSSIRLAVSAGEQLSPLLWKTWKEKYNLNICEGIGTTESTHIFISNRPGACIPGSTGKPVEGYDIHLQQDPNTPAQHQTGQLQITGEGMMLGYWNRLPETQSALHGRTLITADLYQRDDQGNYYFLGRKDALLKVSGMWIALGNIEDTIMHHHGIKEAAIITVPSQLIPETSDLVCYIVADMIEHEKGFLIQSLKHKLRQLFKRYQLPKQFYVLPMLPRTSTGKIDRQALQRMHQQQSELHHAT